MTGPDEPTQSSRAPAAPPTREVPPAPAAPSEPASPAPAAPMADTTPAVPPATTPPEAPAPPAPPRPGTDAELGSTVAALTADDIEPAARRQLLGRLVGQLRSRRVTQVFRGPRAAIRWITEAVADVAPYIPIRDLATLRQHHGGLDGEQLADRLVRAAALATAGVGAASGGVASVEWVAAPTLLSAPVLLAAETVAVVAIELKLVGELHEVYGMPIASGTMQRAGTLIQLWAEQRGVNPMTPGAGIGAVLGTAARTQLRDRLLRRFGRNLTTLGPFLTGAAVASYLNRRATLGLAERVRADLRKQRRAIGGADPH